MLQVQHFNRVYAWAYFRFRGQMLMPRAHWLEVALWRGSIADLEDNFAYVHTFVPLFCVVELKCFSKVIEADLCLVANILSFVIE